MTDYDTEPFMPAVSPGAPVPAPKYVPYYSQSLDTRTIGQKIFGKRPTVSGGWIPASDFLPEGTKKVDVFRGIKPMRNPLFSNNKGPWLDPSYLNKSKITAGDWVSDSLEKAQDYAAPNDQAGRKAGKVMQKRVPVRDLYVPNDINKGGRTLQWADFPTEKMRYIPKGTHVTDRLGHTAKHAHRDKLKAEAKWPEGASKPMKKPGMMTGRMPMVRGLGGGLVDMFMEGPAMQEAKSNPLAGMGDDERARIEAAYQYGL